MNKHMRKEQILDLILTNNQGFFSHHKTIMNHIYSDHNTVVLYLNKILGPKNMRCDTSELYDTKIPKFNVSKGDMNMWENYEQYMNEITWDF